MSPSSHSSSGWSEFCSTLRFELLSENIGPGFSVECLLRLFGLLGVSVVVLRVADVEVVDVGGRLVGASVVE